MNKQEFISTVAELAVKYPSPFFNSVTIAQAIHETGWGTSDLAIKANNLFGIKASAPWTGPVFNKDSMEERKGVKRFENSDFRKYSSWEESVKDHATFLESTEYRKEYYSRVINAASAVVQAERLTGTYATDSEYGKKLLRYMDEYNLYQYDKEEQAKMQKFTKPQMTDRRRQALGYPSHGAYTKRSLSAIKQIVWHYTATTHAGDAMDVIKAHEHFWRNTHGWEIGGYHFYIDRQGKIVQNYDLSIVTYGAGRLNPQLVHVCCEASSANNYTKAQIEAREKVTLWLMQELNIPASQVKGHKEIPYNSTSCPGYSTTQLNDFRAKLGEKFKRGGNHPSVNAFNPQGLKEFKPADYKAPRLPFAELKVGDTVTLAENWSWYNPGNGNLIKSNRYAELIGQQDEIVEIKEVEGFNHSTKIYKLKKYNSWLPQEYAEESKKGWDLVKVDPGIEVVELQDGEYLDKDGNVWIWVKK
ncbi:hypothetical protein CL176_02025 [Suicoccus acidiformans]|uniref:N-acetylmuramoyl-L-alanine amidase n=1 Tax=Suicoccus acidiformans TaxID=2036206 RepID=A0A347WII9_9LACT|nr:glucosaminidase domain-containing protein [Suicoccus acidiformans]AXY24896.1 hypothetical protein CL176_02025 [Suicoccus acidiformans]